MRDILVLAFLCVFFRSMGQEAEDKLAVIDLSYNSNYSGFDLIRLEETKAVIIAEDRHNRQLAPAATLKFLQYLHSRHNIRTLAIEGGASTAWLINQYLMNNDTTLLREITRHTFYWSQEHHAWLIALADWNKTVPEEKKILVESADIEIKQESVILAINMIMESRAIPDGIAELENFRKIFGEREGHRRKYAALNVRYYYDKEKCRAIVREVLNNMSLKEKQYSAFFGGQLTLVKKMMTDLESQYIFDYHSNSRFMYRDDIIFKKLNELASKHSEGFFYVVGAKHTRPGSSSYRLKHDASSVFKGKVMLINLAGRAKNGKYPGAKVVGRIAAENPTIFNKNSNVIIRNDGTSKLYADDYFDYTLALKDNLQVSAFPNSFTGK